MVEGKTILATILANARLELPEGEQPTPFARITLRPEGRIEAQSDDGGGPARLVLDVERIGAGRLAVLIERDLLDAGFRLAE